MTHTQPTLLRQGTTERNERTLKYHPRTIHIVQEESGYPYAETVEFRAQEMDEWVILQHE